MSGKVLWLTLDVLALEPYGLSSRVKLCIVVVYGPTERDFEERERFWNDLTGF